MRSNHYLCILFPLTVVGVIFRFVELIYGVEADTGYYVRGSRLYIYFNVFLIVAVLFLLTQLIWRVKSKVIPKKSVVRICNDPFSVSGIAFLLAAAGITASSVIRLFTTDSVVRSFVYGVPGVTFRQVLGSFDFWIILTAVLSSVVLVAFAVDPKKCVNRTFLNILTLAPVIHFVLRMLNIFSKTSSILSRAYDSFTILSLGFFVLFFMNFAKMIVGMPSRKHIFAFGSVAFFLGITRIAETVLFFVGSNAHKIDVEPATAVSDLIVAVCICICMIRINSLPETREKTAAADEPVSDAE